MSPLTKCEFRTIELPGLPPIELSFVKGGKGIFGTNRWEADLAEGPVHEVSISDFWIMRYPVSQGIYRLVTDASSSRFAQDQRPVDIVKWDDFLRFITGLNRLYHQFEFKKFDGSFGLPSEHQWEYAAKGGIYAFKFNVELFSGSDDLDEVGWYGENGYNCSMPCGLKRPNALGLYDMSGNVGELCRDVWNENIYTRLKRRPVADPVFIRNSGARIIRGGSWSHRAVECRSASRRWRQSDWSFFSQGFRLVFSQLPVDH